MTTKVKQEKRDLRKIRANRQYFQYALFNIDWTKLAEMEEVDEMVGTKSVKNE